MSTSSSLHRLADLAGIEPGFHDIFGRYYETDDAARIALLQGMGLPAASEAEQLESLNQLEERAFGRIAPAAHVINVGDADFGLPLHLHRTPDRIEWRLLLEDGADTVADGICSAEDLLPPPEPEIGVPATHLLPLPTGPSIGYYRLQVFVSAAGMVHHLESRLIIAPKRGCIPEDVIGDRKVWGVATQLYSLRRRDDDPGIGGFGHLTQLAKLAGEVGAQFIGLNPLHAGYWANPADASPYSPATRERLNARMIDPFSLPELEGPTSSAPLSVGSASDAAEALIDHAAVARALDPLMEQAFSAFLSLPPNSKRRRAFKAFCTREGRALQDFALFQALQEHFCPRDSSGQRDLSRAAWWTWDEDCRAPSLKGAKKFAKTLKDRVTFHCWLQFVADEQLGDAAKACGEAGMAIGLYRDLAVGAGHGSAAVWAMQDAYIEGAGTGAPPDLLNRLGQDWGLAPFNPLGLIDAGFAPFIQAIRSNMQHAGAVRIDHAMGLLHLYCVPPGLSAAEGAYVKMPFKAMLGILALESSRNECLVVGEALGTVPDGFRETLADAGVQSYSVVYFERVEGDLFARPNTYDPRAMVTVGTHDLSTLAGWWSETDLGWRRKLDLYPDQEMRDGEASGRVADRRRLIDALIDQGLWSSEPGIDTEDYAYDTAIAAAVHGFAAKTDCRMMTVQMEDLLGIAEQVNLPGTIDEHPNWRQRLPVTVDAVFGGAIAQAIIAAVETEGR